MTVLRKFVVGAWLPAVWLCAGAAALAQNQNGTLRGVVLDPQGAAVSNAQVTVTNENTQSSMTTRTSSVGAYSVPDLLAGPYDLRVAANGFATYEHTGIRVVAAQVTDVTATLTIGPATAQVRVQAGADILQTESSQLSGSFDGRAITEVPVATGANLSVLNLSIFLPNTTAAQGGTSGTGGAFGGLRGQQNSFNLDGVDNNDPTVAAISQPIIPDAVQEVAVNQNVFSAEYGRGSGGQFNVITKTGSNQWHFGGWVYNGNRAYDATNSQEQADIRAGVQSGKSRYDFNRLGGEVGGPIFRSKLFFYGAYEYDDLNQQASAPSAIAPTALGLATLNSLALNSQVRSLLAQFPVAPVQTGTDTVSGQAIPVGVVNSLAPSYTRDHNYILNEDWTINPQQTLHAAYLQTFIHQPAFGSFPQPQFASSADVDDIRLILNHVWTLSPTMVNDGTFSFARFSQFFPLSGIAETFPTISFQDLGGLTVGPSVSLPQYRTYNQYLLGDSVAWSAGRHTIKWGGQYFWYISPWNFLQDQRGVYSYTSLQQLINDQVPTGPGSVQGIGNGFFSGNSKNFNLFIQDDFKVNRRVTVNLGLRYDFMGNPSGAQSNALNSIASLPGTPLVFTEPKQDWHDISPRVGVAWDPTGSGKWAVRAGAGITYDVIPWQLYINGAPIEQQAILQIYSPNPAFSTPCFGLLGPAPAWCTNGGNGFLANGAMNLPFVAPTTQAAARALTAQEMGDSQSPEVYSWTADVQREISRNTRLELRYLGTRAIRLPVQVELNSITAFANGAQPLPTYIQSSSIPGVVPASAPTLAQFLSAETLRYAAQGFDGFAVEAAPIGSSTYNGGSVEVLHRLSHDFSLRASYTYSKTMDNATNDLFTSLVNPRRPQDSYDLKNEWARSVLDVPNKVVLTFTYQTPHVSPNNRVLRQLGNGWEWTGSYVFESGQPVTIQSGVDSNGNFDPIGDRAVLNVNGTEGVGSLVNAVCRNPLSGATSITALSGCSPASTVGYAAVNPNAKYIQAGVGAVATLGRDTYTSPYLNIWNMAILKDTPIREKTDLQLRVEAYDVFNHPDFTIGNLSVFPSSANALNPGYASLTGVPSGTFLNQFMFNGGSRIVQFALKVTY